MACVKPEPLYLVVYMHIPLLAFPKPNKRLWRTREGQFWGGFDVSGSYTSGAEARVQRRRIAPDFRLRPPGGPNKAEKGSPLWKAWIRGDVLVVFRLRLGVVNGTAQEVPQG